MAVFVVHRRRRLRVRPGAALVLPLWWILVATAWLCVWCAVWAWEVYVGAAVRATRTTRRVFSGRR